MIGFAFHLTVFANGQQVADGYGGVSLTAPSFEMSARHGARFTVQGQLLKRHAALQPFGDAVVEIEQRRLGSRRWTRLASLPTDDEGRFTWSGKLKYALSVRARFSGADGFPAMLVKQARVQLIPTKLTVTSRRGSALTVKLVDVWGDPLVGQVVKVGPMYGKSVTLSRSTTDRRGVARVTARPGTMVVYSDLKRPKFRDYSNASSVIEIP